MTDVYDKFDAATRNVSAYCILDQGKPVGRVVLKHGNAVTAYVQLWANRMETGRAGGGGYDRSSAAVQSAAAKLRNDGANSDEAAGDALVRFRNALTNGRDGSGWHRQLEDAGFIVANVIA